MLICPKCRSKNITLDTGGYTGKYKCKKCNYVGALILEKYKIKRKKRKRKLKIFF